MVNKVLKCCGATEGRKRPTARRARSVEPGAYRYPSFRTANEARHEAGDQRPACRFLVARPMHANGKSLIVSAMAQRPLAS
jgi:hypothetical protein